MADREGRVSGDDIYYQVWDSGQPRATVVLSHGYAEHSGRYEHVAQSLVKEGFTVWAPDHRGHGKSTGDRGDIVSWDGVAADLDLIVDAAKAENPDKPLLLVGHSLGGAIAIAYALRHEDKLDGLSLSAPAIVVAPEILMLAELPEIPPLPLGDGVSSDPAVVEAYKNDPLVYQGPPARNLLKLWGTVTSETDRLGELTLPVQIMQGSSDGLIPAQALKNVVAGVSSTDISARLWPGLFHEIFNEPTDGAVVAALASWLADHAG